MATIQSKYLYSHLPAFADLPLTITIIEPFQISSPQKACRQVPLMVQMVLQSPHLLLGPTRATLSLVLETHRHTLHHIPLPPPL